MKLPNKRVTIFIGHYGTGKTTIAMNLALQLSKTRQSPVTLADLDVNNPYFRSRDWLELLNQHQIRVVMPDRQIAFAEMPFLPREIYSVIQDEKRLLLLDMGGSSVGTTVLGSLAEQIQKGPYEMWMVVNTYRPDMETKDQIRQLFKQLQALSKLQITGLLNNTNLGSLTQAEDLIQGEKVVAEAAAELGVAFLGSTATTDLFEQVRNRIATPLMPIQRFELVPWKREGMYESLCENS